jgi:uracil-DNA glycosylase family 4
MAAAAKAKKPKPPVDPCARFVGPHIKGDGLIPNRLMLVAESPGKSESRVGKPLVGPSGQMLWSRENQYPGILDSLHLPRSLFYVSNILKREVRDNKDPLPHEVAYFRPELLRELADVQPEILVAAGGFSSRFFLGAGTSMDLVHGLPHWSDEFQLPVIPCLHPAAALHDTDSMPAVYWDYAQAADFIAGRIGLHQVESAPAKQVPLPERLPAGCTAIGVDTESYVDGRLFSAQVSWQPGTAAFIAGDDLESLHRLAEWGRDPRLRIFIHNAMYDIGELRKVGVDWAANLLWTGDEFSGGSEGGARLIDTMVLAFNRGKIDTQGLKALSYRRLGHKMRSYEDVVGPYQQALARDWLLLALAEGMAGAYPEPAQTCEVVDGKVKISKPWSLVKRIERILSDGDKDDAGTDLRGRWLSIDAEWRQHAERILGPMPRADLSHVPEPEMLAYALDDPSAALRLGEKFWQEHHERELIQIASVDHGALPLTEQMQRNGLPANHEYFISLGAEMRQMQAELAATLSTVVGYAVNPNSSDQIADLVFGVLGLEPLKTTPGGKQSTGKKALQHLRDNPYVAWILGSREYGKNDGFCENVAKKIIGGRCYFQLMATRVKTGRLASKSPNVLALPARTKLGNRVRGGFIAGPGRILGGWDMSQLEMRVMADRSGDADLISAYVEGRDIHTETAAAIFEVGLDQVSKTQRTVAKSISFGVIMGITGRGLADQIRLYGLNPDDWPADRCDGYIAQWLKHYKGVQDYQLRMRAHARRFGYVTSLMGRQFDIPQARCPLSWIREEALRQSHALDIQGSAQDLMKMAERRIYSEMMPIWEAMDLHVQPLLLVHDEILLEMDEGAEEIVDSMMIAALTQTTKLASGVPLESSHHFGKSWADLK